MFKLIILFCCIVLLFCQRRDLNNPFDPENDYDYLEMEFSLSQMDSGIQISWQIPDKPLFKNLLIYKSLDGVNYSLLITTDNTNTTWTDPDIQQEIKYHYYLKLSGDNIETKATKPKSIITGPGNIWMLDSYTWEILKLNYDLTTYSIRKSGFYFPVNMALAEAFDIGLITYPFYNTFEIFDLHSGEFLFANNSILYPFDATYNSIDQHFWLIDSSGTLYKIDKQANHSIVFSGFSKPYQIGIHQNQIIILNKGTESIILYNTTSGAMVNIEHDHQGLRLTNLVMFRTDNANDNLYFLSNTPNQNKLYKYEFEAEQTHLVFQDSLIRTFDVNSIDESIWIVKNYGLNFQLLQLSKTGQRLLEIEKLFSSPRDLKVNPYNGNVIIANVSRQANIREDKVFHYRQGELIGSFSTYGDPFKVYIE
jgi:hypothetical protein